MSCSYGANWTFSEASDSDKMSSLHEIIPVILSVLSWGHRSEILVEIEYMYDKISVEKSAIKSLLIVMCDWMVHLRIVYF